MFETGSSGLAFTAFPDGSIIPGDRRCGGFGVTLTGSNSCWPDACLLIGGHCKASGGSFLPEMTAILSTLLSVPVQADLRIVSDSMSSMAAILRSDSERGRIRAAARPVLTCIRRALLTKGHFGAAVSYNHVFSHTSDSSFFARGNRLADARANDERKKASSKRSVPFLDGEEGFTAWIDTDLGPCHVIGDLRKELKRWDRQQTLRRWKSLAHQGRCVTSNPGGVTRLCHLVRRQASSKLLRFALLALTEWLPSGRYFARMQRVLGHESGKWGCPSCPAAGNETSRHVFSCPSVRVMLRESCEKVHTLLTPYDQSSAALDLCATPAERGLAVARQLGHQFNCGLAVVAPLLRSPAGASLHQHDLLGLTRDMTSAVARLRISCSWSLGACWRHGFRPSSELCDLLMWAARLGSCLPESLPGDATKPCLRFSSRMSRDFGPLYPSPWHQPWSGRFALCAPPWVAGPQGDRLLGKSLEYATRAVEDPRPARFIFGCPNPISGCDPLFSLSDGKSVWWVSLLQNDPAARLAPLPFRSLMRALTRIEGYSIADVSSASPEARPPSRITRSFRMGVTLFDPVSLRTGKLLHFWDPACVPVQPAWLQGVEGPSRASRSFQDFASHDWYAGILGVLPRNFSYVLACAFSQSHSPDPGSCKLADSLLDQIQLGLLVSAEGIWSRSTALRSAWWSSMDDRSILLQHDSLAQHRFEKSRSSRARSFARSQRLAAARHGFLAPTRSRADGSLRPLKRRHVHDDFIVVLHPRKSRRRSMLAIRKAVFHSVGVAPSRQD